MHPTIAKKIVAWVGTACLFGGLLAHVVAAESDSGFKYIEVQVLDPTGKPLADVDVDVKMEGMDFPMPTNQEGVLSLNVPSGDSSRLQLGVKHESYAAVGVQWRGGQTIPSKFEIKLTKGEPIGGLVHDEQGQPIEGVTVDGLLPDVLQSNGKLLPMLNGFSVTTDAEGRWQVRTDTSKPLQLQLRLSHSDYISDVSYGVRTPWQQLLKRDHPLVLRKGIELRGQVTSTDGEPIADALVMLGESRYHSNKKETVTDAEGNYRLANVPSSNTLLTVAAVGWAPDYRKVQAAKGMEPIDFQLQLGKSIEILATDPDGVPLEGVGVAVESWQGRQNLPQEIYRSKTNAQGIWASESMPPDEVDFSLFKRGHMSARDQLLTADGKQHTVVLPWPLEVKGRVVDAESGLPIEKFTVIEGIYWGNSNQEPYWERYNRLQGQNGKYRMEFDEPREGHLVRIEAEGYRPNVSRVLRSDEGEVTINFEMVEGIGPSGTVKTPAGQPANEVRLFVATKGQNLYIINGRDENNQQSPNARTDAEGRFTLPYFEGKFTLVCLHDTGWAELTDAELQKSSDVTLQAWTTVEGQVLEEETPLAEEQIRINFRVPYVRDAPSVNWSYQTKSGINGEFRFERVISGDATIGRSISYAKTGQGGWRTKKSHTVHIPLTPGKEEKVQIGGTGRAVRGKLVIPDDYTGEVDWNMGAVQITEQQSSPANSQSFFHALGKAIAQAGSKPVQPQQTFRRSYATTLDKEGNFTIHDVLPGSYSINVDLFRLVVRNGNNYSWNTLGTLHQQITIPELNEKTPQDPFDLGEFLLDLVKPNPPASTGFLQIQIAPAAPVPAKK